MLSVILCNLVIHSGVYYKLVTTQLLMLLLSRIYIFSHSLKRCTLFFFNISIVCLFFILCFCLCLFMGFEPASEISK